MPIKGILVALTFGLLGCAQDQVSNPLPGPTPAANAIKQVTALPALAPGDSAGVDSLTRALALALASATFRQQVHEDLRDSPFSKHRVHLASYLKGSRGKALAAALTTVSGLSAESIGRFAAIRGGLEISMPGSFNRMFWKSSEPVLVEGSAMTLSERKTAERVAQGSTVPTSAVAFMSDGKPVATSLAGNREAPLLYLQPALVAFGTDPERTRASAPKQGRGTISSFDEEILAYRARGDSEVRARPDSVGSGSIPGPSFIEVCPPDPELECNGGGNPPPPPPPPRPMGVSLPSGRTYATCYRPGHFQFFEDGDGDGVLDSCESELAVAFKPQLVLMFNDCELRRQPQFAVRQKTSPDWGGVILIFYAISWVYDCGPYGHRGDTEWIIEEVGPSIDPAHGPWSLKYATLSAHWGQDMFDNTAGYAASDLEDAEGSPGFGAPRIWVSKNKHANYRSRAVCGGVWGGFQDSCVWPTGCYIGMSCPNPTYFTLSIGTPENLGSHTLPFKGRVGSPVIDGVFNSGRIEYYWVEGDDFCGWLAPSDVGCTDPYWKSLTAYGF